MIRVCLVAPRWMTGGQAVEAQTLLRGFAKDPDIRVEIQPIDPKIPGFLAAIPGLRTLCRMPLYHAGLLRRILGADVVHVFTAAFWPFLLTTTPAILYGRLLGRPVILNYRDGRARDHLKYGVVRWILRRATVLVFPSGFLRDIFAEFDLDGQVISNVVDTSRFVSRHREPLRPVLISSRLLEELYAVENTILAFELVRREHPDARLLVVGDGDRRPALEELVRERQIPGVEFVGRIPHEEMGKWFDEADIMVNSSRIDNMPHCLIEAFAAGLPVVTTPSGGIPYIVEDGVNGLHVATDDPVAMARAIQRLLGNAALANRLVAAGRQEVGAKYGWNAAQAAWRSLYQTLRTGATKVGGPDDQSA